MDKTAQNSTSCNEAYLMDSTKRLAIQNEGFTSPSRMRQLKRWPSAIVGILLMCGFSACVPVKTTYYSLSSPEGATEGECGSAGKSSSLVFTRADVKVVVHEVMIRGNSSSFYITVLVPQGDIVHADWRQLQAIGAQDTKVIVSEPIAMNAIPSSDAFKNKPIPVQFDSSLDGNKYSAEWGGRSYSNFDISFKDFPVESTPAFDLVIPDIWVNDVRYPGFTIHYQLTTGMWLQSINC